MHKTLRRLTLVLFFVMAGIFISACGIGTKDPPAQLPSKQPGRAAPLAPNHHPARKHRVHKTPSGPGPKQTHKTQAPPPPKGHLSGSGYQALTAYTHLGESTSQIPSERQHLGYYRKRCDDSTSSKFLDARLIKFICYRSAQSVLQLVTVSSCTGGGEQCWLYNAKLLNYYLQREITNTHQLIKVDGLTGSCKAALLGNQAKNLQLIQVDRVLITFGNTNNSLGEAKVFRVWLRATNKKITVTNPLSACHS
jgi:hypothetical protein